MVQAINNLNTKQKSPKVNGAFSVPVTMLPEGERNYCLFNQAKVNYFASQKEHSLPYIKEVLQNSNDEKEIVETLYILDKMIDNGTKGIPRMYLILAKFNDTKSSNIQTFLAGIYRKIQVPDAFGPLVSMLIRNSILKADDAKGKMQNSKSEPAFLPSCPPVFSFDPNEEIGGAILAYIENYSKTHPKIDYSA